MTIYSSGNEPKWSDVLFALVLILCLKHDT